MNSTPSIFVHHRREKLLNAIAWFSHNTKHCHTLKLFKLLYLLDFEHYRQTGRSVTGLDYHAFPKGPVPRALLEEIKKEPEERGRALRVRETHDDMDGSLIKREFTTTKGFDETYFTLRELQIMEHLALFFSEAKSDLMSAYSHDPNFPWKKVYGEGEGKGRVIPYELALYTESIVNDEPTIEEEDVRMLDEVFKGTRLR